MLISKRTLGPDESIARIDSDRWDVSMATTHAGYPSTNLQTDNLDDVARAWGNRRSHTTIKSSYLSSGGTTFNIDYVAVPGLNRREPDAALYDALLPTDNEARLIIDTVPYVPYLPPVQSSLFATTNLTGTYDVLNQIVNPPEEALAGGYSPSRLTKVSNASNTVVDLAFENTYRHVRPYAVGADLQEILIHARDSVDIDALPTLTVLLRQYISGAWVTISTLIAVEIEDTSHGFIFRYTWNAASLTNLTDIVGLRITGATTGTSTPEYYAVTFRAEVTGGVYDSGWNTITNSAQAVWLPELEIAATEIHTMVQFSDLNIKSIYSLPVPGSPSISIYTALPEALTVGRFLAGSAIEIPLRETGLNPRKVGNNQGSLISAYGGFLRANRTDLTRWEVALACEPQPQSLIFGELDRLFKDIGFVVPALFIDTTVVDAPVIFWAILTSWQPTDIGLQTPPLGGDPEPHFELAISIMEVNAHSTRRIG